MTVGAVGCGTTPCHEHATCAWCDKDFGTIVELIDHVDNGHLEPAPTSVSMPALCEAG